MTFTWEGVFPALTTKFTEDDQLDIPLFVRNLEAQARAGVAGVIIGGTLGEASVLTTQEKEALGRSAKATLGNRIPVIMNIAESSTREAIHQASLASQWNVDGLMLLPPMRYKADDRETVTYFKAIASSTDLPIMIYNNPVDYRIDVTPAMFGELSSIKTITAIKDSTRDITNITRMRNRFGDRFAILCGVDTLSLEAICAGADGLVAGLVCAFPVETVELYRLLKAGKLQEALALYRWFMPLLELDIHPKLVQYIKLAEQETGLGSEYVRAPRLPLEGEERKQILEIIRNGIASRPELKREQENAKMV